MKIQEVWVLLLGCLLLGALPACGTSDDDDTAGDDDDTVGDDDTAGDDDSAGDDDDSASEPILDSDGDGFAEEEDCNDADPAVHPTATELCDQVDNDCDGATDESDADDAPTWYEDGDGDGYGVETSEQVACNQPHGYSAHAGDCNDGDPSYHPGAAESDCTDPNDYNCDGSVGYADADNDGVAACEDCDDNDISVNSAATEACNSVDDDCDGEIDEVGASGEATWYLDADGDGYGRATVTQAACDRPPAYVDNSNDCDDLDASSFPGGVEVCDGADNNCDLVVDEGVTSNFYGDGDGDGYGDAGTVLTACFLPAGASNNSQDCDDSQPSAHPGGIELCDGFDNDCNGAVDDGALDATTWYVDSDGDGTGEPLNGVASCSPVAGTVSNALDCDDSDPDNYPGNTESCDGADQNCNGAVDESFDADSDGVTTCGADGSAGTADDDCDDGNPLLFPGNSESCDGLDQDCDTVIDNSFDQDNDGVTTCGPDGSAGTADDDCDDTDSNNLPGGTEVCDGQDNNCDLSTDEGFDSDLDNHTICGPDGIIGSADDDCDDADDGNFPGNTENCDGTDEDCDSVIDNGFDSDGDGITTCGPDGIYGTGDEDCDDNIAGAQDSGLASSCPADSCASALAVLGTPSSGSYWLDLTGSGVVEVYCDMTTDAGGWALVMTASSSSSYGYDDSVWSSTSTANTAPLDPTADVDVVSPAFYDLLGTETRLCLERYDDGVVVCHSHNHGSNSSARDLANGSVIGSSQGTTGLLPANLQSVVAGGVWAAHEWHRYGWQHGNVACGGVRLGFSADNDGSDSRDSAIGVGLVVNGCAIPDSRGSGYFHYYWGGHPNPRSSGLRSQIWIR